MASLPLRLYNQKNELIDKHPFYDLMKTFNPDTTEFSGKEGRSIYKDLTGECYILMAKDGLGIPRELYFRSPDRVTPKVEKGITSFTSHTARRKTGWKKLYCGIFWKEFICVNGRC